MTIEEHSHVQQNVPRRPNNTAWLVAVTAVIAFAVGFGVAQRVPTTPEPLATLLPSTTAPLISTAAIAPRLWEAYHPHRAPDAAVVCLDRDELACQGVPFVDLGRTERSAPWDTWSRYVPARLSAGRVVVGVEAATGADLLADPDPEMDAGARVRCPRRTFLAGNSENGITYFFDLGCLTAGRYMLVIGGEHGVPIEVTHQDS